MNVPTTPNGYNDANSLSKKLINENVDWLQEGKDRAYQLFTLMHERVPAYRDFIKNSGFEVAKVSNFDDLSGVPPIDKDNYLRKYSLRDLSWDGGYGQGGWVISTTSGSSGEPYYFPRQKAQNNQYGIVAEQYFINNFSIDKQKTLYIIGFPMGAWIGGIFTYDAANYIIEKGHDLTVITTGIHKRAIIDSIKKLSSDFDQIVIGAYAPFLKDILDDGVREGVDWKNLNVKFIFSAEGFTENFRNYVQEMAGLKNIYLDTLNHYGTVDLGTMAHETPYSIAIRRALVEQAKLDQIFPETYKQPTLCQYDPNLFFFEERELNLYCSAYSGIPLFRYDLKDYGGVIGFDQMEELLKNADVDVKSELKKSLALKEVSKQPYVYVYERNDFSVSYYAFNLYPDPVRKALQTEQNNKWLTGKFSMEVVYAENGRQQLDIHVEKKHSVEISEQDIKSISISIHEQLMQESSEYPEIFGEFGDSVTPRIIMHDYEDHDYFMPGAKQKWILK